MPSDSRRQAIQTISILASNMTSPNFTWIKTAAMATATSHPPTLTTATPIMILPWQNWRATQQHRGMGLPSEQFIDWTSWVWGTQRRQRSTSCSYSYQTTFYWTWLTRRIAKHRRVRGGRDVKTNGPHWPSKSWRRGWDCVSSCPSACCQPSCTGRRTGSTAIATSPTSCCAIDLKI